MDFLLVLIELVSLVVTAEVLRLPALVQNRRISLQRRRLATNFSIRVALTNHSSFQKTRLND